MASTPLGEYHPSRGEYNISVVIAEDHCAVREMMVCYLSREPRYVLAGQASTGIEALQMCTDLQPNVLILDLGLPQKSGLEVLPEVRKISPNTKVLVFTGRSTPHLLKQAVMAGAQGIIVKQSALSTLVGAIDQVARGNAFFCPMATQALHAAVLSGTAAEGTDTLSLREREVLRLVAEGGSTKHIAIELGISPRTAENHRTRILSKLGAHNAADLTRVAYQLGLMQDIKGL